MDHLPYSNNLEQPPIEIPYLCEGLLEDVLEAKRFSASNFSSLLASLPICADLYAGDSLIAVSKAQLFIFFGLVREVTQSSVVPSSFRMEDFIREPNSSGQRLVTLKKLGNIFDHKRDQRRGWDGRTRRDNALQDLRTRLEPSLPGVFEHIGYICSLNGLNGLEKDIALSIEILAWSLAGSLPSGVQPTLRYSGILQQRMLKAGWCPYWTEYYANRFSSPLLHSLAGTPRSWHAGHESCSQNSCTAHNIDPKTYKTRHISNCRLHACSSKGPDMKKIEHIIATGGVPLIRFSKKRLGRKAGEPMTRNSTDVEIDVVEHRFGRPFVAISHVWSGGMGNVENNTLPQCQLNFMYESARKCKSKAYGERHVQQKAFQSIFLSGIAEDTSTIYVWIDTLCIPIDRQVTAGKDLKTKAISKMALIYASAMHVLVIDETILKLSLDQESDISLAVKLLTSPWMSRCWTFQEAYLAREFSFLLQDRLIAPRGWPLERCKSIFEKMLVEECLKAFWEMPDVLNESVLDIRIKDPTYPLFQAWNELATRMTSHQSDLHKILAVLLGLSVQEIFDTKQPTYRMPAQCIRVILGAQASLPLSMLYLPYPINTELCEEDKWVPHFPSGSLDARFGSMEWASNRSELHFTLSDTLSCAFILSEGLKNMNKMEFYISPDIMMSENKPTYQSEPVWIQLMSSNICDITDISRTTSLCIILHGFDGHHSYRGACFSVINSDEEEHLRIKFICPLKYRQGSSTKNYVPQDFALYAGDINANKASQISSKTTCVLECDPSIWRKTVYRRPKAKTLQKSLSIPIGVFLILQWGAVAIISMLDPRWEQYNPLLASTQYPVRFWKDVPLMGWFMTPRSWMMRFPKYILPCSLCMGRLMCFMEIEYIRLEAIAERIRYERYSNSFDDVPRSAAIVKNPNRLRSEPSYQFPRLWQIVIPVVAAGIFIYGQARFWRDDKNNLDGLPIQIEVTRVLAWGIIWEIPGRVIVELVWRYFSLDVENLEIRSRRKSRHSSTYDGTLL